MHNRLALKAFAAAAATALFVITWMGGSSANAQSAGEVIRDFDVRLQVTKDGLLDVKETIVMDFGSDYRHGIRRIMPIKYDTKHGSYRTPTRMLDVLADGSTAKYTASNQSNDMVVKVGDPDRTITGRHTYQLHYCIARAINVFDKQPEIYWNATGNESPFPIDQATAEFILPAGVNATDVPAQCFRGLQGSKDQGTFVRKSGEIVFSTSNLAPSEGLTFVLRLPPGTVSIDNRSEMLWWLMDWWPAVFTPWLALALVLTNWWTRGRDPANAYIAGVDWNPPKELTPAEVGTLVDERCDIADIVSTLVDLAAKGYLKIQQVKNETFFFSRNDYRFTKTDKTVDINTKDLKEHERFFYDGLFALGSPVLLFDLKNRFYTNIPIIKNLVYTSLTDGGYFVSDPEKCRNAYQHFALILLIFAFFLLMAAPAWGVGLGLSGFIIMASGQAMPARTRKGVDACRQSLGFERFVQKAEKERIRVLAKDDPTIFGRLLPYAMVLGAADRWAGAFQDLLTRPPDWYEPADWNSPNFVFSSTDFVNDLGDGMRTCATTLVSTPPPPSSGSSGAAGGFSGFGGGGDSGGGGFSGGGFGGGGVGSW